MWLEWFELGRRMGGGEGLNILEGAGKAGAVEPDRPVRPDNGTENRPIRRSRRPCQWNLDCQVFWDRGMQACSWTNWATQFSQTAAKGPSSSEYTKKTFTYSSRP